MAQPPKAIVFDLDGTLVDTAADLAAATNEAFGTIGRRLIRVDEIREMIGGGFPNLIDQGLRATGGPLAGEAFDDVVALARSYYNTHVAGLSRPFPGVIETLAALAAKGVVMGVCTNKPAEPSQAILDQLGLAQYLPVVVAGDTLPVMKPDRAMLLAVLERLSVGAADAILVGDSATDVALGRAAGVPIILVAGGYSSEPIETLGADNIIDRFADLPTALSRLP